MKDLSLFLDREQRGGGGWGSCLITTKNIEIEFLVLAPHALLTIMPP